jgi:hypothetical protein
MKLWLLCFMVIALLCGCGSSDIGGTLPEGVLFSIGGTELGQGDIAYLLDWVVEDYSRYHDIDWQGTINGVSANRYFLEQVRDIVLESHITGIKAAEFGFFLDEDEEEYIEFAFAQNKDYEGGAEAFSVMLDSFGISGEMYRFYTWTVSYLREKMIHGLFGDGGRYLPGEEELRRHYLSHYRNVSFIFLDGTDGSGNFLDGEDYDILKSYVDALRLEASAAVAGAGGANDMPHYAPFFEMVEIHGVNYFMSVSPEGMPIPFGRKSEEFDRALRGLSEGEVSEVIEDRDGFYIILRLPADNEWFELNSDSVWYSFTETAYAGKIAEWARELSVVVSDSFWEIDVLGMVGVG